MRSTSTRTMRTSSLGKHVIATHLCIKRKVGFWMSLQRAPPVESSLVMDCRKLSLWNPLKVRSTSTEHHWWKPKSALKSFHVKENSLPNKRNKYPPFFPQECKEVGSLNPENPIQKLMRTWHPWIRSYLENGMESYKAIKGVQIKKEARGWFGSSLQGGGPKKLKFKSISESRSSSHQNRHPSRIQSLFWMLFIWMER